MGNIRVENCCCLSLQTGVIILGAFDLITGILTVANGGRYVAGDPLVGSDFIVEGVLIAICGLLLILGVRKANPNYFIPFLVVAGIGVVRYFITFIYHIYNGIQHHVETSQLIGNLLADLLVIGLAIYFWIVVYSLYKSLKEGTSNRNNSGIA